MRDVSNNCACPKEYRLGFIMCGRIFEDCES